MSTFKEWWLRSGQYSRAGGGGYEKTFAFNAWNAALALSIPAPEASEPAVLQAMPQQIYDLISCYGKAHIQGSEMQRMEAWLALVDGIKAYAGIDAASKRAKAALNRLHSAADQFESAPSPSQAAPAQGQAEQERDAARLDWLQSVARCDPKMDGQHVWWPLNWNTCQACKGPTIRAAIDAARSTGENQS